MAPILFLGWGNPSRGDDAIGPLLCDRLSRLLTRPDLPAVTRRTEVQQDFQLQVEDASDIAGRELVVFIDASLDAAAPFEFSKLEAREDASVSTHALSPQALMATTCKIFGAMPLCYLLAVRGEAFELGEGLSASATLHLEAGWQLLREIVLADQPVSAAHQLAGRVAQLTRPALA